MRNILKKEKVCEICHGEKYIQCCSVDGSDCELIVCPHCNGRGKVADDKYKVAEAAGILLVVLVVIFLICR